MRIDGYILRLLEKHHAIFYQMVKIGWITFTDSLPTAAVSFNKEGKYISFMFNQKFWNELDDYGRAFILCHECLHVLLEHGKRLKDGSRELANVAMDVVINDMLIERFGFDRKRLEETINPILVRMALEQNPETDASKVGFCFRDTVFRDRLDEVEPDQNAEYYYSKLKEDCQFVPFDVHLFMDGDGNVQCEEMPQEELNKIWNKLSEDQKQAIKDYVKQYAGNTPGGKCRVFHCPPRPKMKWETVIKNWAVSQNKFKDLETWIKDSRRVRTQDFFLPAELEEPEPEKIEVWFFQDTSGSCYELAERFFAAANSLPKKRFDVKLFCFDTQVYEVVDGKLSGWGGTSFSILEDYVAQHSKSYPKAVFVITDGYGDKINPSIPDRWHWFLSTNHKECIPDRCNTYNLEEFE